MKTKHLMMAMALPVAFAACSQEEIVTENTASDALKGRKEIGQITLTTGNESRWAVDAAAGYSAIRPDAFDGFAAMLVDAPKSYEGNWGHENLLNDQHKYAVDNYYITPFISTNYKFEKNGDNWDSKASMVEGHYVFMAPFNADQKTRTVAKSILPTKQQLKFKADGKTIDPLSAINDVVANGKTVFYLGHRFLDADVTTSKVPFNFYHLYAYPEITVLNPTQGETGANSNPVTVTQVVLEKAGDGFVIDATFDNQELVNKMMNEVFAAKGTDTKTQALRGAWAGATQLNFGFGGLAKKFDATSVKVGQPWGADVQAAYDLTLIPAGKQNYTYSTGTYTNGLTAKTSDVLKNNGATSKYIIINMPEGGVTLQPGEKFSFNAVIPADDYKYGSNTGLTLWAVLKSDGQQIMAYKTTPASQNEGMTINAGKRYPQEDYSDYTLRGEKGNYFTIRTRQDVGQTGQNAAGLYKYEYVPAPFAGVVSTTEELKDFILNNNSQDELNITTFGDNVRYTKAVNDAIAMNSSQVVNIAGPITIDAEAATTELVIKEKVTFDEAVATNGSIKINNSVRELIVMENATVAFGGKTEKIHNFGTLKLNRAAVVDNYKVLNVATKIERGINNIAKKCDDNKNQYLHSGVSYTPSVNVLANGGDYNISGYIDYPITVAAHATVPGKLTLAGDVTLTKSATQSGKIENSGKVVAASGLANKPMLTIPAGFTSKNTATGEFASGLDITIADTNPIWNADVWTTPGFVNGVNFTARATFENAGKIKSDLFVNGFLKMTENAARLEGNVTTNTNCNGEIDNTKGGVIANVPTNTKVFALIEEGLRIPNGTVGLSDIVKKYDTTYSSSQVTVLRLVSKLTIDGVASPGIKNNPKISTLEFADGASVEFTTDDAKLTVKTGWKYVLTANKMSVTGRVASNEIVMTTAGDATKAPVIRNNAETGWVWKKVMGSVNADAATVTVPTNWQ